MLTIHLVQDVPTPHNNSLLAELAAMPNVALQAWYFKAEDRSYGFPSSLAFAVVPAQIYCKPFAAMSLLTRSLLRRDEIWLVVAWSNRITRAFLVLHWISRRRYGIWFDLPDDHTGPRRRRRDLARWFLKHSRAVVLCVGEDAVNYFSNRGFAPDRLVNFPVVLGRTHPEYQDSIVREAVRKQLRVPEESILVATGSRLVKEKGFDILIEAVAAISRTQPVPLRLVIVGQGEEYDSLEGLVKRYGLTETVTLSPWLPFGEFERLFIAADLVVQPSRSDAYGGAALLALALGRPILGTRQSGASREIVIEGLSGWLYDAEDVDHLGQLLRRAARDKSHLRQMGLYMDRFRSDKNRSPAAAARKLIEVLS